MADDKGGGSSGWEPFEIIIVILLAVGLLSQISGKKITPIVSTDKTADKKTVTDISETVGSSCGLYISRPRPLEDVSSFITLHGSTEGCDWQSTDTVALYAQVIDSRGTPISRYETIPVLNKINNAASFNSTIQFTATPKAGTGYLILVPAKNPSNHTNTLRIPITFK